MAAAVEQHDSGGTGVLELAGVGGPAAGGDAVERGDDGDVDGVGEGVDAVGGGRGPDGEHLGVGQEGTGLGVDVDVAVEEPVGRELVRHELLLEQGAQHDGPGAGLHEPAGVGGGVAQR